MPTPIRSACSRSDDGFVMLTGASAAALLLEIGVVEATTRPVVVHAMRARERFLR